MAFKDLDEFLTGSSGLELPIGGKVYAIPDLDGPTGLWAQRMWEDIGRARAGGDEEAGKFDDADERLLVERMLGSALEEMLGDGVTWTRIQTAGMTAYLYFAVGEEAARKYWEAGGDPEAMSPATETPPNRASRRASAAAARTTRKAASGSGTKAKASKPSSGKKAGSPGRKSSTSGS